MIECVFVLFQAEDGIRDAQESRGLGDVYKRQGLGAAMKGLDAASIPESEALQTRGW